MKQTTGGMEMYMVRGTELNDFLRCRLAWKYRWIDGLQPKKPNTKLAIGTLVHAWLEAWYKSGLDNGAAWNAMIGVWHDLQMFEHLDQLELNDTEDLLEHVVKNYATNYGHLDLDGNWEVIATELTFAIPLDDEIGYTGTIDLIVRDKSDGRIYFLDHKTTNSIEKYDKNSDMDRQISRYWWALQQLQQGNGFIKNTSSSQDIVPWVMRGEWEIEYHKYLGGEIGGFLYNIILKDFPTPPKVLKNGSLSKDKSQKTTYEMYLKELEDRFDYHQFDDSIPEEYDDILQHLHDSPKEFFRRIRVTRTQSEIDASIEELYATAMDMSFVKGLNDWGGLKNNIRPIYRNITKDCPWCPFQPICRASMDGSNVEYLTESLYTKEETK